MPLVLNDRYYPYKILGKGGFAATYLAIDGATSDRQCVVKQLQPNPRFDNAQLELAQTLFRREATALAKFGAGHPQIPNLYDFFPLIVPESSNTLPHQEFFYLIQEFVAGKTLSEELKTHGALSIPFVLNVFEQVLDILDYVHQHHSIHRDIKPSNLMLHPSGQIYLLDFGAVKQASQIGGEITSEWSSNIYSPGYAPPEQVSGAAVYPATDLYALAVTCVVLLTGEKPRKLLDPYKQSWRYRDYVVLSDALAAIFDRCLAPAPSDRFASALEALQTLHHTDRSSLFTGPCSWSPAPRSTVEGSIALEQGELEPRRKISLATAHLENPPGDDEETGFMEW
jgi:serine/threonine-protein kinase